MDATTKTAFVIAFAIAALLLFLFGGGMATGAVMHGGAMGNPGMAGLGWVWLPIVLVALGAALLLVVCGKK